MFEQGHRLGETERDIPLATRTGRPIPNLVEQAPTSQCFQKYQLLVTRYGQQWRERKPPTGGYNCAGLVWACRRTSIFGPADWEMILREDGYRPVAKERVCPGDVAVYLDREQNEILHVGRVFGVEKGLSADSSPIPWVISKWNSTSGESMHSAYDTPYPRQGFEVEVKFYTDRLS